MTKWRARACASGERSLVLTEPRIEPELDDIDQQVGGGDRHAAHEDDAEDERNVDLEDRLQHLAAEAGPAEDQLDHHRAAEQDAEVDADEGDQRADRVAQRMATDDGAL